MIGEVVADQRRDGAVLRRRQAGDPAPGGLRARWASSSPSARARWGATAVGGLTMGADPVACAALAGGADVKAFFVRKDAKAHGLQRRIEGPLLEPGDRCLVVEDVVTTGGSTLAGDRGAARGGPRDRRRASACSTGWPAAASASRRRPARPTCALTTIDDVYPDRPDR